MPKKRKIEQRAVKANPTRRESEIGDSTRTIRENPQEKINS